MEHLVFYHHTAGGSKLKNLVRRAARKAILPMCQRLVEILTHFAHRLDHNEHEVRTLRNELNELRQRHEDQSNKLPAALAFGWDYVAMVRRLAVLEEHVDTLMTRDRGATGRPSVHFTALEAERA
ncbi:hypothetical protein TA3x_003151 [Tundrisphaera sp. TA3]|uniref:hypothetical protein n=1 Tax=Tundrisphaera sp. TA3 TaxID=3435775 RepID=UPI003EB978A5